MDREALVEAAVAELRARGVGASDAAPPLFRLLWSLGVFVPPPHFLGFLRLASLMGGCFALGMAPVALFGVGIAWLAAPGELSLRDALAIAGALSLAAGTLFGSPWPPGSATRRGDCRCRAGSDTRRRAAPKSDGIHRGSSLERRPRHVSPVLR